MLKYFFHFGLSKSNSLFAFSIFSFVMFIYICSRLNLSKEKIVLFSSSPLPSTNRTHDFRLYPQSRSAFEYKHIQMDNVAQLMFIQYQNQTDINTDYSKPLNYSETTFRLASIPIIWLDTQGDVRWNYAAQHEILNYLLKKQFPNDDISTCLSRQSFILNQRGYGFFSRYHSFIEHFGHTLYSPSMVLLSPRNIGRDDFRNEGILRYYQSISLCSSHLNQPQLKILHDDMQSIELDSSNKTIITNIQQLLERDESTVKYKYSREMWKFSYHDVPHRRWLFDRNRKEIKQNLSYHSPIKLFIDHSNEHIYYDNSFILDLTKWIPRNKPYYGSDQFLNGTSTTFTIPDQIFTSFLRYMFLLFFSQFAPRIQTSAKILAHHWSEYLSDKYNIPYDEALSKMTVLYIRRRDKHFEDSYWKIHGRWRNISMYVKGIVDEEKHRQIKYTTLFIMTDDMTVMSSIQEYSRDGLTKSNKDEPYARQHLYGREILYNVFAPQSCLVPFTRHELDQFLVNIQFITDYASLVVGHTDSNVARYLEEIIYVNRQHHKNIQTRTFVVNAPDSLD